MQELEIKLKKSVAPQSTTSKKNIAKNAKKNPKAFFLYVISKCKSKDGISGLKVDQQKITSDESKANVLNQFFTSVFTDEDLNSIPNTEDHPTGSKLAGFEIHEEEVLKRWTRLLDERESVSRFFQSI
jgi:hypothetical protein